MKGISLLLVCRNELDVSTRVDRESRRGCWLTLTTTRKLDRVVDTHSEKKLYAIYAYAVEFWRLTKTTVFFVWRWKIASKIGFFPLWYSWCGAEMTEDEDLCLLIVNQITLLFASSSGNFDFSTRRRRRRFLNTEWITSLHRFRYTYDEKNLFSIFSRQFSSAQLLLLVFFFNVALFGYFHFAAIYLFFSLGFFPMLELFFPVCYCAKIMFHFDFQWIPRNFAIVLRLSAHWTTELTSFKCFSRLSRTQNDEITNFSRDVHSMTTWSWVLCDVVWESEEEKINTREKET